MHVYTIDRIQYTVSNSSAAIDEFGTLRTFSASSLGLSVNGYRYNAKHTLSYEEPSAPESKGVNRPGV